MLEFQPIPTNKNFQDLTGQEIAGWEVVGFVGMIECGIRSDTKETKRQATWLARCNCTLKTTRQISSEAIKKMRSGGPCACLRPWAYVTSHHMSSLPMYKVWCAMRNRCFNESNKGYHNYGGRGIRVCQRFNDSFEAFLEDLGHRPGKHFEIDREDNGKGYDCGKCDDCKQRTATANVRWVTRSENQRNTRVNRIMEYRGEKRCMAEWAEILGIGSDLINSRLQQGFSDEEALSPALMSQPVFVEYKGEPMRISQLAKKVGMTYKLLQSRLGYGWSVEDAISRPRHARKPILITSA